VYKLFIAVLALVGSASVASAQTDIAQRVSRAPDGVVRMQYASRPGTCGDGGDMIGYRKALYGKSFQSFGRWTGVQCVQGPLRVLLTVRGGRVTAMETYVSGVWAATRELVTDLGVVSAADAAGYFFDLVPLLEGRSKDSRLLLPAVLAADNSPISRLSALARDGNRLKDTRRQAVHWLGMLGDATTVPTLVSFARAGGTLRSGSDDADPDDSGPGERGLASTAAAALGFLDGGVGVSALIDLARNGASGVRAASVFWLGQSGDPRAISALHGIIENQSEDERVRSRAIFSLSHGDDVAPGEFRYLGAVYPRLGTARLKEAVLQGMGEDKSNGSRWLLDKAGDANESVRLRKQALFWAGQSQDTPTGSLVAFYKSASDRELRDHAIFVLSQRDDDAALNELMRIAREDGDKQMRSRAMFWLGQKDDPRVTKMISDRLSH
jgi:HEAT repeat protein